jgi:hypothetical protein
MGISAACDPVISVVSSSVASSPMRHQIAAPHNFEMRQNRKPHSTILAHDATRHAATGATGPPATAGIESEWGQKPRPVSIGKRSQIRTEMMYLPHAQQEIRPAEATLTDPMIRVASSQR